MKVLTYTRWTASEGCLVSDRLTNDRDINQTVFKEPVWDMRRPGHKHCDERPLLDIQWIGSGKAHLCTQDNLFNNFFQVFQVFSEHMGNIITNGMQDSRPCIKECWGQGYFMGPLSAAPLNVGQSDDLVALTSPNVTASGRSRDQTGNGVDYFSFAKYTFLSTIFQHQRMVGVVLPV